MLKTLPALVAVAIAISGFSASTAISQSKPCPPGLDKRDNGCLPPGIAKRYIIGEPLPEDVPYELITDLEAFNLLYPDGDWLYYLVDDEILRIADATFIVLEALGFLEN